MSKLLIDTRSSEELEPEVDEPSKPLHEYVRNLLPRLAVLWASKRLLIAASVTGLVLAIGLSFLVPVKYQASCTLMPPGANPVSGLSMMMSMKTGFLMNSMGGQLNDVLGMKSPGQLYIRQMGSLPVQEALIKRFDLQKVYGIKSKEKVRKVLSARTKFEEDRKSGVVSVEVMDKDPKRAADIANAYPEEMDKLLADMSSTAGRHEREYFENELLRARGQLTDSSKALAEFSAKYGVVEAGLQDAALVTSSTVIQTQIVAAETELKSLSAIYGEDNVRIKGLRERIAELQRQFEQVRGKAPVSGTVNRASEADSGQSAPSKMGRMAGLAVPYSDLYRQVKVNEALVETLTQQYEFSKLQETRHFGEVQVLEAAQPPEHKSSPKRREFAIVGFVIGFLLALVYVFSRHWWINAGEDDPWKQVLYSVARLNDREPSSIPSSATRETRG